MQRAIVTGATSMLGIALIRECIANSIPVIAIVRPSSKKVNRLPKSELIEIVECEMSAYTNLSKLIKNGSGVFYHFAWNLANRRRNDDLVAQTENIKYTLDALSSASEIGCELFIGVGSQAEYGSIKDEIIGPYTSANPDTPYGISKYAAGKLAMLHSKKLSIGCIWTRVFSVYGEYDHEDTMISTTLSKIKAGEPTKFTDGSQMWDYLYCQDAGKAFFLLGIKGVSDSIYCIASGQCFPLKQYFNIIEKITKPQYEMGIGKIDITDLRVKNLCADIKNLVEDTGFEPSVNFEEGIRRIWNRRDK